jgi:hypothetical protein
LANLQGLQNNRSLVGQASDIGVVEMLVCFYLIASIISIGFSLFMATSNLQAVDIYFFNLGGIVG